MGLASDEQFRSTFEGALSYFVKTGHHDEDSGFAIKGWTAVRFENEGTVISGTTAMAMGNYFFTGPDGSETKVEYSFGYELTADGVLRITLHHSSMPFEPAITRQMVEDAQQAWGDGIVTIAAAHTNGTNFTQAAFDHITNLYAYGHEDVLFKPTLASDEQFRSTFEGALSYFVATGHNPEDSGFAIKGWTAVRFVNDEVVISGTTALAMGNYYFTNPSGREVKVEYSFGYKLVADGTLRITLHHSSMPYEHAITREMVESAQEEG